MPYSLLPLIAIPLPNVDPELLPHVASEALKNELRRLTSNSFRIVGPVIVEIRTASDEPTAPELAASLRKVTANLRAKVFEPATFRGMVAAEVAILEAEALLKRIEGGT